MSKPIFLIQIPFGTFNNGELCEINNSIQSKLNDWHVIVFMTSVREVQFAAFSEQAATDVELESFKEMITNQLKQVL